jgi:putative toxin-antitoxin system antitoxin component (TIGR02293 family)
MAGMECIVGALDYETIRKGVPAGTIRELIGVGRLRRSDVAMVIPRRTFERRLSQNQALKIDEADALARLLRVRDHALRVFEDDDLAEEWLSLANPELGDEIPIDMARTDVGAREVEAVLGRIEHGVYA